MKYICVHDNNYSCCHEIEATNEKQLREAVVDLMESFDQNTKITVHEIKSSKTFRKITRVEIEE